MRCALLLVVACSHREPAKPLPPLPPPPPPPAPVADAPRPDASIPTASGDWKRDEVDSPQPHRTAADTIRAQQAALRRCYEHGGSAATSVVLAIGSDGQVTSVHLNGGDAQTDACLERAIRAMHFDEGPAEMLIPFTE